MKLYAYVDILCIRNIKFPYYIRTLHQTGVAGIIYHIECYSFAEVDYYKQLCSVVPGYLMLVKIWRPGDNIYKTIIDGGPLSFDGETGKRRNKIDGEDFNPDNKIRNYYIADIF